MNVKLLTVILLLVFYSCSPSADESFSECKYSKPGPVFDLEVARVIDQAFVLEGRESIEKVAFDNGMELTIRQSGCDYIHQVFEFRLPGRQSDGNTLSWILKSIEQLEFMGDLGPEYLVYHIWGEEISKQSRAIMLGESFELQPGYFISIDRSIKPDHAILVLTLSEKS